MEGLQAASEDEEDVLVFLPDFREFIKWVVEVRRREENGGKSLSEEVKGRLAVKRSLHICLLAVRERFPWPNLRRSPF
ncbi:Glutathione gamma-glutamylcysteinyltransferase 1 [Sarracenia purpurea var. burkii]